MVHLKRVPLSRKSGNFGLKMKVMLFSMTWWKAKTRTNRSFHVSNTDRNWSLIKTAAAVFVSMFSKPHSQPHNSWLSNKLGFWGLLLFHPTCTGLDGLSYYCGLAVTNLEFWSEMALSRSPSSVSYWLCGLGRITLLSEPVHSTIRSRT